MEGLFRKCNRTHTGMKTFQGGKTKIFTLIKGSSLFSQAKQTKNVTISLKRRVFTADWAKFFVQTLGEDQKKDLRVRIIENEYFFPGNAEFRWEKTNLW